MFLDTESPTANRICQGTFTCGCRRSGRSMVIRVLRGLQGGLVCRDGRAEQIRLADASACGPWPESRCWCAALPMADSEVYALACRIDQSFAGPFARSSREIVTP